MAADAADLPALRSVTAADVVKAGRHAGTLTRTPDGVVFAYLPDWDGPPVATTLPVGGKPVLRAGGALPAYFAGLLPEGRRLGALQRAVKTSADDELSLLLAVGADTIGDVQVVPAGLTPAEVPARVVIERIEEVRFADLLRELGIRAERVGLPGVQDKTSAAMINLPLARAGERHILKLDPAEFPHLVANEAFFLDAARTSGLTVPPAEVVYDADGTPGLLVTRFDRITSDGAVAMRAVEDGTQACDRPPADKYLLDVAEVFTALSAACDARALTARELIRQLAFAYLIGNGDAHAKNFAIRAEPDGEWRTSPLYDTPSSYPYGDTTMALPILGRAGPDFGAADFLALGTHLGVPERAVRRSVTDLAERVDGWLPGLNALPFDRAKLAKLRRVILRRRERLTAATGPRSRKPTP